MKSIRFMLSLVLLLVTAGWAQSATQKTETEAQKSFTILKSLAGNWEGKATLDPAEAGHHSDMPDLMQVSLRVTSRGNALVHEMTGKAAPGAKPEDNDHPVTMLYVEGDRLILTHYCDAGNRPRMVGKISPDGKTVEFDFLDVSGSTQYGRMQHATFTIIDANHHIEEWTYQLPGDKAMRGRLDLQRVTAQQARAR